MKHPFDGVMVPAHGGADEVSPAAGGTTRRSLLGRLLLALGALLGLRSAGRAQGPSWRGRQPPRPGPGGRAVTTYALGEEGGLPPPRRWRPPGGGRFTTQAVGEEGGGPTTFALGEEGGGYTTQALGEEGGGYSTRALGEEGGWR